MGSAAERALLHHARTKLWANPMLDTQAIFGLTCLTSLKGQYRRFHISGLEINFPTDDYYLAYHLTSLPHRWLGLIDALPYRTWRPITDIVNNCNAMFQIYNSQGVMVSMADVWMCRLYNNNILLCLRYHDQLPNLTNGLYFRTYSNAVVVGDLVLDQPYVGQVIARHIRNDDDRTALIQQKQAWVTSGAESHQILAYVNGGLRRDLDLLSLKVGDYVDLIWDDTIRTVVMTKLDPSRSFVSTLDQEVKYIVQRGKMAGRLDYFDDVDFFVYSPEENYGAYYHRNQAKNVRQLTHSDYAVPAGVFNDYINYDVNPLTRENSQMLLYIRDTLGTQTIPNVACRLSTLYRLPEKDILFELSSPVGHMQEWRAENLEVDPYTKVMRHPDRELPLDTVVNAYGYHGIIGSISLPYLKPVNGVVRVPEAFYDGFTLVYTQGGLVRIEEHPALTTERSWSSDAPSLVNFYQGSVIPYLWGHLTLPDTIEVGGLTYAVFARLKSGGEWVRVDHDPKFVLLEGNTLRLTVDQNTYDVVFYRDDQVLVDQPTVTISATVLLTEIPLTTDFTRWRHLDVYKDDRKLIPELEYRYADGRLFYVGNDLTPGDTHTFTVIFSGLAPEGKETNTGHEVGFIVNNQVSYGQGRYLLDDRAPLINISGELLLKDECNWAESQQAVEHPNGKPYSIECRFPNIGGLGNAVGSSEDLLTATLDVDKRLKDYLDYKYPLPPSDGMNVVPTPLGVCSHFMAMAYDKRAEVLFGLTDLITMPVLESRTAAWAHLAESDICKAGYDKRYLSIRPHALQSNAMLSVTAQEYDYLDKLNHFYLDGVVPLKYYFSIRSE